MNLDRQTAAYTSRCGGP